MKTFSSPRVEVEPLVSLDQRKFMQGYLSADDYLRIGQEEAEKEAETELAHDRTRQLQRLLVPFSVAASTIYLATAVVFLIIEKGLVGSALAAFLGAAFMVLTLVTSSLERSARRREARKEQLLRDA